MGKQPIQLSGLRQGDSSRDGQFISFTLLDQGNNEYAFSCPQEAVTVIIEALEILADLAWKQRGSPDIENAAQGTKMAARSRTATGLRIDTAREGIVLSIACGPLTHQVILPPENCVQIGDALRDAPKERLKRFPSN